MREGQFCIGADEFSVAIKNTDKVDVNTPIGVTHGRFFFPAQTPFDGLGQMKDLQRRFVRLQQAADITESMGTGESPRFGIKERRAAGHIPYLLPDTFNCPADRLFPTAKVRPKRKKVLHELLSPYKDKQRMS